MTEIPADSKAGFFGRLAEDSPICMVWFNAELKHEWANAAWRDYTGKQLEEPLAISEIIHAEEAEKVQNALQKLFEQPRRMQLEFRFLRHDGEYRWHQLIAAPVEQDGVVKGIVGILSDITDQMMVEEQMLALNDSLEEMVAERTKDLQQANEELKQTQSQMLHHEKMASVGQLAAGVAHEINNPMGFIASNLNSLEKYLGRLSNFIKIQEQLLKENLNDADKEQLKDERKKLKIDYLLEDSVDLIDESKDGAGRVQEIVRNLKSFSRVDQAAEQKADLNECLESTIAIAWNELKYKVTLEKEYGDLPTIHCHPQQLNQVFMNLLVNGAHAIDEKGIIKIKTWHEKDSVFVQISDSGCGIPEENLTRIFEPFFTTKEVGKGTGLGMSISYDIVKSHDGEILVESTLGAGTTFIVQLPMKADAEMTGEG